MSSFSSLPPEVRNTIWGFSIPEDKPDIYFYDRSDFEISSREWPSCRVITARPSILHVCKESATFAKTNLSFTGARDKRGGMVKVPCRRYRPSLDAVYISLEELEYITDALKASDFQHRELFRDMTHIALESQCLLGDNWWTARRLLHSITKLPALRTISMVFGKTWEKPYRPNYSRYPDPDNPDPTMSPEDWEELEDLWDKWELTVEPPFRLEEWTDKNALLVDGDAKRRIDREELLLDMEAVLSSHLAGASNDHEDNCSSGVASKVRMDRHIDFRFSKMVIRKYSSD